jgi:hypothetical protein
MSNRWIRCIECNQVAHVTEYDRSPLYQCDRDYGNSIEKPMDDMKSFMMQHGRHSMEELSVIKDSFISEGKYGEPRKASYFQATNGKEQFVIKGWREDINVPLQYELIPGCIKTTLDLKVQSYEIQMQMREEIKNPPAAETEIEQGQELCFLVGGMVCPADAMPVAMGAWVWMTALMSGRRT